MGAYVKGMEMPTNREVLVIFSDGNAGLYDRIDVEILDFPKKNRKAIPVPDHGRLIDADALIADIRANSESYFADDFAHEWVDVAPTVIPASGEEMK